MIRRAVQIAELHTPHFFRAQVSSFASLVDHVHLFVQLRRKSASESSRTFLAPSPIHSYDTYSKLIAVL